MEETDKLPLKRVELSLSKFNDVAIPHQLELLRQHRANIIKHELAGEFGRVRAEQTHARRVVAQLGAALAELAALRRRVRRQDCAAFDQRTQRAQDATLRAIQDYLETSPLAMERRRSPSPVAGSALSTDSVGVVAHSQTQLQVDERAAQEQSLREREAALRGWAELQGEVRELHEAWALLQRTAQAQREAVEQAAGGVGEAAENVAEARASLSAAEKLRAGAYGAGGALAGALVAGPVGALLGAKLALAAALAGGALGYAGARALVAARHRQIDDADKRD